MGSSCRIVASHPEPGRAAALIEQAFDEIDRWNGVLSDWTDDSELALLNAAAASPDPAAPTACSPDLFAWLEAGLAVARETGGAFDPTVGALVDLYAIRSGGRWPSAAEIEEARARVGHAKVILDSASRSVSFSAPGMRLDPGGNGKGVAMDAAAGILRAGGISWALIDFGGQILAVGGGPGGDGFEVELPGAPGAGDSGIIRLANSSAATTSNSERSLVVDGRPLGHILDPTSLLPVSTAGSLTVVAATAARADALSTALFVVGPERALEAAERLGVEFRFVPPPGSHLRAVSTRGFPPRIVRASHEAGAAPAALAPHSTRHKEP
jgi:thiamine biosynthesis lipoprotein